MSTKIMPYGREYPKSKSAVKKCAEQNYATGTERRNAESAACVTHRRELTQGHAHLPGGRKEIAAYLRKNPPRRY